MSKAFYDIGYTDPENLPPPRVKTGSVQESRRRVTPRADLSGHSCYIGPYEPLPEDIERMGRREVAVARVALRSAYGANPDGSILTDEDAENVDLHSLPPTYEQGDLFNQQ